MMPNCDPRDRFVYPYLTRLIDSFSCTPQAAKLDFYTIYLEKRYNRGVRHFDLKRFDVIVTCALNDKNYVTSKKNVNVKKEHLNAE